MLRGFKHKVPATTQFLSFQSLPSFSNATSDTASTLVDLQATFPIECFKMSIDRIARLIIVDSDGESIVAAQTFG